MEYHELNDEKKLTVDEFKAISGVELDDDLSKVIQLLSVNDWNLNNAIGNYFDSGFLPEQRQSGGNEDIIDSSSADPFGASSSVDVHDSNSGLSNRQSTRRSSEYMNLSNSFELNDLIPRLPNAPKILNNWQIDVGIYSSLRQSRTSAMNNTRTNSNNDIIRKTLSSIWIILLIIPKGLLSLLIGIFKFLFKVNASNYFPLKFDYNEFTLDTNINNNTIADDVQNKYTINSQEYNELHDITKNNYTWLLVILVNDSDECQRFLNQLLNNEKFDMLFNKQSGEFSDCQMYINNVDRNPEAFEIGDTYKAKRLPYVMLVGNVTNNPSIMSSMSLVYKSNISSNFLTPDNLATTVNKILVNFTKIINNYQPQMVAAKVDKQEMEFSRLLKQRQDNAYERSLLVDKEKRHKKLQKLEKEKLLTLKNNYLLYLYKTQWFTNLNQTPEIRIQIKLPNGSRIIEKLNNDLYLHQLYLYLEMKLFIINNYPQEPDLQSQLDTIDVSDQVLAQFDYSRFPFKFELIQPYPKKGFNDHLHQQIKDIEGFKSGASLLVEYEEDDEDEEENENDTTNDTTNDIYE